MASPATDQRAGMEVVEGPKPASANEDTQPLVEWTLAERMAAIRSEAYGIGKDTIKMKSKAGAEFTIKGHTVEAVLSEMRPLFEKYRVDMSPNLVERTYTGNRCDILVDFEFESLDNPADTKVVRWAGAGTDDGDKGFSKAGTNALKEMLKKRFLITDRDDAKEEEEKVEHRTDDAAGRRDLEKAQDQRRGAIAQWAKTFKAALENAPSVADVDRLKRENREQLDSEDLPDVTRQFFNELIADRKAELADGFPGDK
jgi:hypothetical protein